MSTSRILCCKTTQKRISNSEKDEKTDPYTEKEIQTDKIRCVKNEFKNEKGEKSNPSKFHGKNADYAGTADYTRIS